MNCTIYQSVSQLTMTDRNVIAETGVTVMTVLSQWRRCHTYTHSVITVTEVSHLHTQCYHSDRGVTPTHTVLSQWARCHTYTHSVITVSEVSHLHTHSVITVSEVSHLHTHCYHSDEMSHLHTQCYHSERDVTPTHSVITVSEVSHLQVK